jgi:hypothetical protein
LPRDAAAEDAAVGDAASTTLGDILQHDDVMRQSAHIRASMEARGTTSAPRTSSNATARDAASTTLRNILQRDAMMRQSAHSCASMEARATASRSSAPLLRR